MKKVIRLTESDLHKLVKESVKRILNENSRYSGEYDRTGLPLDDTAYTESIEYILDSIINGNISQAKELINGLDKKGVAELILYAQDMGYRDEVLRYL
jgi:hypothetical protein